MQGCRELFRRISCGGLVAACLIVAPLGARAQVCAGDCDENSSVTIDELVRGVNIALGLLPPNACPGFDENDGAVTIDELIVAVNNALRGCGAEPTATPPPATEEPTEIPTEPVPTEIPTEVLSTETPAPTDTAEPTATPTTPPAPESTLTVRGVVRESGDSLPLADATVQASIDRNGDGSIDPGEQVSTTTDEEGTYELAVGTLAGETVVIRFAADGYADGFRTVLAGAKAEAVLNVALSQLQVLRCTGPRCALDSNSLSIVGLPDEVSGSARVFNPVTETQAFPGGFDDSDGNLLVSGVFAALELTDGGGQPIEELAEPVTLRMRLPRQTWSIVEDVEPGNGTIDVPLYSFDEVLGTWVRDGQAVLEDADGSALDESALPEIRSGTFAGALFARGEVDHFSYWNVDWPIETHAAVDGTITDADGMPAGGATVEVRGTTYTGSSGVQTTGGDGRFCADVLRSEMAGEDVDSDGATGETQRVSIRITYQGKVYDGGEHDTPDTQGSCTTTGAIDLGTIQLTPERELVPQLCVLRGTVVDLQGMPAVGATVVADDQAVPDEIEEELCKDEPFEFCLGIATTDETGAFELTTVILENLTYGALHSVNDDGSTLVLTAEGSLAACPSEPIEIVLSEGIRFVEVTLTAPVEGPIAWEPAQYKGILLTVSNEEDTKWTIYATETGFESPVAYGTAPDGAEQLFPLAGTPPDQLNSADSVSLFVGGVGEDGYPYFAITETAVP